ncbi:MAG: DNA mismatch repair endonuclease MutL [Clostridia bacterium]|nr:DNA mismatch repair endonuclease MutL [Clostridia bacterium]
MGDIVLLDEQTINKIAAGEVVDRPASIVKELVENSIDAKATSITVEIRKGGISSIKIIDNGTGFKADDVEMAFERHATSKIRKEEDLARITSMGFRGEALASVAAISKVLLISKNVNEPIGTKTRVEGGNIISKEEYATVTGTRIEISDVFYNVPARYKFLKKDYTEAGYIEDVITRIALSNPQISFRYINNGKTIIQTSGTGNLRDTIYDIFGKEIYDAVIPIDYEINDMKVIGMIGMPSISRSTRMHQFTFINNRYIKDKTISTAIDKACEQKFAINKHPFVVCNIFMNPATIDVNVHPAKLEVKFADESKVFDVVYHAIRSALEKNNRETSPFTIVREEKQIEQIEQISKDLINNGVIPKEEKHFDFNATPKTIKPIEPKAVNSNDLIASLNEKIGSIKEEVFEEPVIEEKIEDIEEEKQVEEIIETPKFEVESYEETNIIPEVKEELLYKFIGNVFDTYIIIQIKEKMYIIDQHAAHERLLYEQIKEAYYSKDRQTQLLLIPVLVDLSTKEMDIVRNNMEMFEKSGFMLEEFGDTTIKISGVPNIGYDIEYKSMFKDIIEELLGANKTEKSEKEFRFLATLACKAAVKGRMKLDRQEQINLIDEMVKLDNPFTCPHGRPTAYEISKYDIERRFLRK